MVTKKRPAADPGRAVTVPPAVGEALASLDRNDVDRYKQYWLRLAPESNRDHYERWLFALCSVNTSWQNTVRAFLALKKVPNNPRRSDFESAVRAGAAGMFRTRLEGVCRLHRAFWDDPREFRPREGEDHARLRERVLSMDLFGLGMAKVSFALEMIHPASCTVVCLDRHAGRLFGVDGRKLSRFPRHLYLDMEAQWLACCRRLELPSAMARHALWDRLQRSRNNKHPESSMTEYWSHVFHPPGFAPPPPALPEPTSSDTRLVRQAARRKREALALLQEVA